MVRMSNACSKQSKPRQYFIFLKNVKIDFRNNYHMLIFLRDVITASKTKLLILFTSLMNIE
jgi:hypothetical protein